MRFHRLDTRIAGANIIEREVRGDARGFLSRLFSATEFAAMGWTKPVAQINHSLTQGRGTLRGLHFQHPPHAEAKLVTCIRGAVLDVAVDLRAGSPTLLQHVAVELSRDNRRALVVPEGCAHGFQALTDDVELLYVHSAAYASEAEDGLNPRDPRLDIAWPLPISEISPRDEQRPLLATGFAGIRLGTRSEPGS